MTKSSENEPLPSAAPPRPTRLPGHLVTLSPSHLVILLAVVLLVLGVLAWLWQRGPAPRPPVVDLEEAEPEVALLIRGELDNVRRQSRSGAAWGRLGQVLRAHGFDDQAVACWSHAERFDDQEPRWPYYRGVVLLMTGDNHGLDSLRRAIALADRVDPTNADLRLTLAEQLLSHSENAEAEQVLAVVARKQPNNPRLLFAQAALAERAGNAGKAIHLFTRLTKHPCARQRANARLAALFARSDQPDRAAPHARLAAQLPEDDRWPDDYWAELAELDVGRQARFRQLRRHHGESNDQAAYEHLLRMTEGEDAGYSKAHLALGTTLVGMGQLARAEQSLRKGLTLEPKSVRALRTLGLVLLLQVEEHQKSGGAAQRAALDEAAGCLRRAIELKPNDADAHLLLGSVLRAQGRRKEAIQALRLPVATQPEDYRNHVALANALIDNGELTEARKHLDRASQLAPAEALEIVRARQELAEKEKSAGRPKPPR